MVFENASNLAIFGFFTISISLVLLIIAYIAVRSKFYQIHKYSMGIATISNTLFLILYIFRLITEGNSEFNGPDWFFKTIYIPVLVIHILTAIISIYFVLFQVYTGIKGQTKELNRKLTLSGNYRIQHKKQGKRAIMIWASSFVGGILVFFMLYGLF